MRRWTPDEPMSRWPDEDLRQVIDLMRTTYLEYCRAGLHRSWTATTLRPRP